MTTRHPTAHYHRSQQQELATAFALVLVGGEGEKNCEDMFIRFDRIYERDRHIDRQADGQTPHDG